MIENVNQIEISGNAEKSDDENLLKQDAEKVRSFYSLTGPSKKEYTIQMAEAEAERIRIIRKAQAEGILEIRKAEAEGLKIVGEVLDKCENRELVVKLASLVTLQDVAKSIGDGQATKLFIPHNLSDIFSLVGGLKELSEKENKESTGTK